MAITIADLIASQDRTTGRNILISKMLEWGFGVCQTDENMKRIKQMLDLWLALEIPDDFVLKTNPNLYDFPEYGGSKSAFREMERYINNIVEGRNGYNL